MPKRPSLPTRRFVTRRRFLGQASVTAALAMPAARLFAQSAAAQPTLTLHPDRRGPTVPENFIGLSYEIQQLEDPSFFSPENHGLIAQFRALAPRGVLRLGGNTSDVGWWKPTPSSPKPPINVRSDGEAGEPTADLAYAIEPRALHNLRGFLDATGWNCLFGINLGTNTPAAAAAEAEVASRELGWLGHGGHLEFFQLGNEPDLFRRHLRDPAIWTADAYFDEWLAMADAIRARVPEARFGLPDTAGNPEWMATITSRLLAIPEPRRPRVGAITHHYYFGGPPANPAVNLDRLLRPDPKVRTTAEVARLAGSQLHAPWRMTEGNTCFRGGKPGVSDVFGAALWAADYALTLATLGYSGLNLHGGSGKEVANSLGGKLPGEAIMPDPNVPHPRPFYTPIAFMDGHYVPQPVFFGLALAQRFAGARIVPVDFHPGPVNATAYAAELPTGQLAVILINKDKSQPLPINLPGYSLAATLTAPSLESHTARLDEPNRNRETSTVAPASAVLLLSAR